MERAFGLTTKKEQMAQFEKLTVENFKRRMLEINAEFGEQREKVLSQLVENNDQMVSYGSENFYFEYFSHDGVILTRLDDWATQKQVYVPVWALHEIVIL